MSMFLPENAPQQQPGGVTATTPPSPETTQEDVSLMQRVFAAAARNPNQIPNGFLPYVLDWLNTQRLEVPIGQVFGFKSQSGIRGSIDSDGTILVGSGLFTVNKSGTGVYNVTLADAFEAIPTIVATPNPPGSGAASDTIVVGNVSTSGFRVFTFETSTATSVDQRFGFWAFT